MKSLVKIAVCAAAMAFVGCGSDAAPTGPAASGTDSGYVVGSLVFGDDVDTSYVNILQSLGVQTIDYDQAREFSGAADLWVHEGSVFVADGEALTITKYSVIGGQLSEQGRLGFSGYGLTSFGFWLNAFVAKDKAYFLNESAEYIVWNPETMTLTGTIEFPKPAAHGTLKPFPGYADRASVLRDGKLYQAMYWTDDTYFQFSQDSQVLVVDVATDRVDSVISAPCPGLDFATSDSEHNLFFSSWVYAAGGAQVLQQPATCVFEIPSVGEPSVPFEFSDITNGHQGAAFRYLGNGKALLSVLQEDHADDPTDSAGVTFGNNWRFWTYDMRSGSSSVIDGIDWNAGGQYTYDIDGKTLMLVPKGDYSATTVFDITDTNAPSALFETKGWATRLFKLE